MDTKTLLLFALGAVVVYQVGFVNAQAAVPLPAPDDNNAGNDDDEPVERKYHFFLVIGTQRKPRKVTLADAFRVNRRSSIAKYEPADETARHAYNRYVTRHTRD